jgi:opacity protein-like surface antigen
VGRRRIALLVIAVLTATAVSANAQPALYTGLLTGHLGVADGGDVQERARTLGGSVGVVDESGLGAEIDLGYTDEYDETRLAESNITSFMVNFLGAYPHPRFRPFVVAGLGVLRVGTGLTVSGPDASQSDWAYNAGGGLLFMLNDVVGIRGDVRYFRFFERHDDIPFVDNGYFDYWRTSIGLTWTWPMK